MIHVGVVCSFLTDSAHQIIGGPLLFFVSLLRPNTQEMVEGWRAFTTAEFSIEQVRGSHLFVYDADARDSWFESITDALVAEGF